MKPFTCPDNAPDHVFMTVYAYDVKRNPRMAIGLRDEAGRLYYQPPRVMGNRASRAGRKPARSVA